jgi:hypothetical protein
MANLQQNSEAKTYFFTASCPRITHGRSGRTQQSDAACLFQYLQKQIAGFARIQGGLTTIATAGYEMQTL